MTSGLLAILSITALVVALAWLVARSSDLKRSYYLGVTAWSRWLPVVGTVFFLGVLAANLVLPSSFDALSLHRYFSTLEVVVLFLVGPLFLTRIGPVLAGATVLYCIERLVVGNPSEAPTVGLQIVCGAATFAAVLGDRIPWLSSNGPSHLAQKLRDIMLIVVTIACLAIVAVGIVKVHGFNRWLSDAIAMDLPVFLTALGLVALFMGWLTVALGFTRHFTIPLLMLPSLFVVAFVTDCPTSWLVIPFALMAALSLATAERRLLFRRRSTSMGRTFA